MIPDFQTIMLPMLQVLSDGKTLHFRDLVNELAKVFKLTEVELHQLLSSGNQEVFKNRVAWATTHLKKSELIASEKRSYFTITKNGIKVLESKPDIINLKFLKTIPEFAQWRGTFKQTKETTPETVVEQTQPVKTPDELMEDSYGSLKDELVADLLSQIKSCSPVFFERLVIDLLTKMGYGGSRQEAGRVLGKTGDGGIDGVINEDKLGLDTIYVQAKRWENYVPVSQVRDFAGALLSKKAKKGVFITTSSFPKTAHDFVKSIEPRIVLIDGIQLANYMIEFDLGVTIKTRYDIKKIDGDYFNE